MKKVPIVVSGSIAIDRIMRFPKRYKDYINPDKLDSISISPLLDDLQDVHGGVAANICYSMAMLGEEPILLGSVGRNGLLYMEELAHKGVNITHVFESRLPTAAFTVFTDADQNQIAGFYPGAMYDSDTQSLEPWKSSQPIVVVSPNDPRAMRRQVAQCADWNLRLFYDVSQQINDVSVEDLANGVETAELIILNDHEISMLSKKLDMDVKTIKQKIPVVITTMGKQGSVIEGKNVPTPIRVGVCKPSQVADPTGAGDAFRSGFLYGFARGWPLKACAQLGAICGTYAVETMGTQGHSFTLQDVKKRYEQTFNEELPSEVEG